MDIKMKSDNAEKNSQNERWPRLQTVEDDNVLEYENNKMRNEIENLIADNNDLKEKINAQDTKIVVLKNEYKYLLNLTENPGKKSDFIEEVKNLMLIESQSKNIEEQKKIMKNKEWIILKVTN